MLKITQPNDLGTQKLEVSGQKRPFGGWQLLNRQKIFLAPAGEPKVTLDQFGSNP